jgi:molybdenum cofactor biosynthesis enzyme MoaA/predicted dehydrogenase
MLHGGGSCELRCAFCDCAARPSAPADIDRALVGGGARVVIRGPTEHSAAVPGLIARARREGFSEVVLRTNAIACRSAAAAAAFARLGADAALVPLFSTTPAVHDRLAGREGSLLGALAGMRNLSRAGLGIEIEVPILSPRLQQLEQLVRLAHGAAPALRAIRFYVPPPAASKALAPPAWDVAAPSLAAALLACRELAITARLSPEEGVPLCALRETPDLYDAYAFNPKARSSKRADATFAAACDGCAARAQCAGLVPSYRAAHGDRGIAPYARRPALMYAQRTTRPRTWTRAQRSAASSTELLVLRPTVNCNQDCTFCSANETSSNVWVSHAAMLRAIARAARRHIHRLSFSGGEPTLSKHLADYVHCAARLGVQEIELVTNAVLLDRREKVDALAAAGLTHAFVSLHAHDEHLSRQSTQKIGDFARTVQGIRHLVAAGVETALNHVITARNYPYLPRFVEFVRLEFGGRVKVSFAFVTPQFKALDNLDLMPRLSDVIPHLKRAMYRALAIGQPFSVGSRQGIPFCFLGEFRGWSDGIDMAHAAQAEDAPQKQRGPECDACRFSDHCVGLWRPYAARYGFGELRPVPGPKLTDEELGTLRYELMPEPWHVPRSFDEVPDAVRERALESGPPEIASAEPSPIDSMSSFVPQRTRPLRIAMLGSGRQARRLARAAGGIPGLSLDAVASPHALQADLADFGDCPAYADAATALDDMRPDAVIIAAATAAHESLARLALDRGIPVLLEKPIADGEAEAIRLRDAARAAGAVVIPAHNSLHASGLGDFLVAPHGSAVVTYVCRRTAASQDAMRSWSRAFLYETVYHVLAVVGRACGGGVGTVVHAAYRGDARPERLRVELRFGGCSAEVTLDFASAVEDDLLTRCEGNVGGERTWRRQGRIITITDAAGVRPVEAAGNDVERMLANFRDVVLGEAAPGASLDEAIDVMRTARRVVDAVAAAGAPFERPSAPKHVASPALQHPLH